MNFIRNITKSRAFMGMSEEDVLHWYHYLGALVKLICYVILAVFFYFAIQGFFEANVPDDYTQGETYPF